jgi:hypothetical protein
MRVVKSEEITDLPPKARQLFLRFYNVAGGSISHPNDHERFNQFIRHCHARRVKLTERSFRCLLLKIGTEQESAVKLAEIYFYCRSLLHRSASWD